MHVPGTQIDPRRKSDSGSAEVDGPLNADRTRSQIARPTSVETERWNCGSRRRLTLLTLYSYSQWLPPLDSNCCLNILPEHFSQSCRSSLFFSASLSASYFFACLCKILFISFYLFFFFSLLSRSRYFSHVINSRDVRCCLPGKSSQLLINSYYSCMF